MLWQARGFVGGLAAVGLAFLGQQAVLERQDDRAAACYVLSMVLLVASLAHPTLKIRLRRDEASRTTTPDQSPHGQPEVESLPARRVRSRAGTKVGWQALRARLGPYATPAGLALSLLLAAVSAWQLAFVDITSPLAGWLWAASLVVLLVTFLGLESPKEGSSLLPGPYSDYFWKGVPNVPARVEIVLMGIILLGALVLRLYALESLPLYHGDEGERGLEGRRINEGAPYNLFGFAWGGVPNLYFYCVSWFLRLLGDTMASNRLLSVISGMVVIWCAYRIGRLLWGPRVGILAAAMLAVSPLALQFSRSASESSPTGALWAVGFYFLFMALRYRRWSDWVLMGMAWGFNLYFYAAGKLILPLVAIVGFYLLARWRTRFVKNYALGFGLGLLAMGLVFMPNAAFSARENWSTFTQRAQDTSILSPPNQAETFNRLGVPYDASWAQETIIENVVHRPIIWGLVMFGQMRLTTEALYKTPDPTLYYPIGIHNGSMLQPLWAALALLGLAYALWKFTDARYGIISLWFFAGLMGAALTVSTPSIQRITGAWPAVMFFPAIVLDRIFAASWPMSRTLARRWSALPLAALLAYLAVVSYDEYFVHYPAFNSQFWNAYADYAKGLGDQYKVYQLTSPNGAAFDYGVVSFVAKGVEGTTVPEPADYLPVTDDTSKGAAFMWDTASDKLLTLVRGYYPDGKLEPVSDKLGRQYFYSYKVSAEQMAATRTVRATYTDANGRVAQRNEAGIGTPANRRPLLPPTLTYPMQAQWTGSIVVDAPGQYNFRLQGNGKLDVDGNTILVGAPGNGQDQALELAHGVHPLQLSGTLQSPDSVLGLSWVTPDGLDGPIPRRFLYNDNTK